MQLFQFFFIHFYILFLLANNTFIIRLHLFTLCCTGVESIHTIPKTQVIQRPKREKEKERKRTRERERERERGSIMLGMFHHKIWLINQCGKNFANFLHICEKWKNNCYEYLFLVLYCYFDCLEFGWESINSSNMMKNNKQRDSRE